MVFFATDLSTPFLCCVLFNFAVNFRTSYLTCVLIIKNSIVRPFFYSFITSIYYWKFYIDFSLRVCFFLGSPPFSIVVFFMYFYRHVSKPIYILLLCRLLVRTFTSALWVFFYGVCGAWFMEFCCSFCSA